MEKEQILKDLDILLSYMVGAINYHSDLIIEDEGWKRDYYDALMLHLKRNGFVKDSIIPEENARDLKTPTIEAFIFEGFRAKENRIRNELLDRKRIEEEVIQLNKDNVETQKKISHLTLVLAIVAGAVLLWDFVKWYSAHIHHCPFCH